MRLRDPNPKSIPNVQADIQTNWCAPGVAPARAPCCAPADAPAHENATECNTHEYPPILERPLSARQMRAIAKLAAGKCEKTVASEIGVDRATLWRWSHRNPIFMAELQRHRRAAWDSVGDRLHGLMRRMLRSLASDLVDKRSRIRQRATSTLAHVARGAIRPAMQSIPAARILDQLVESGLTPDWTPDTGAGADAG